MSTFTGFSEEDLKRIKTAEAAPDNDHHTFLDTTLNKKSAKFISSNKKKTNQYKTVNLQNQRIDDAIDDLQFDKCRLSLKPTSVNNDETVNKLENIQDNENGEIKNVITIECNEKENKMTNNNVKNNNEVNANITTEVTNSRVTPDVVRGVDYAEGDLATHQAKMGELQLKQKIMEEQNKKRKEILARALADRTRQTEEEVLKLDKIKKELQVLDGQFSHDVGLLRKKIDLSCLTYSEAEKHYLKVEKEFLQAKIQLQKEKEKKELLTEHLCALITHNETRKAQKLETLMLELATHKTEPASETVKADQVIVQEDDRPVIVDGVDQRNGKMYELNGNS